MNKIKLTVSAVLLAMLAALFTLELMPDHARAQSNLIGQAIDKSLGNWSFKSVKIFPALTENPTNSFLVWDTYQTNAISIVPTNAQFAVTGYGSNGYALMTADIIYTNNAATTRHLIIRNGLIMSSSTF